MIVERMPRPLYWAHRVRGAIETMAESTRKNAQGFFIPIALVGALVALLLAGARGVYWAGQTDAALQVEKVEREKLAAAVSKLAESKGTMDQLAFDRQVQTAAQVLVTSREVERQEKEIRVLKDFVEGRIGSMPYRPTKGEVNP